MTYTIGIPKETKIAEKRVALLPAHVGQLTKAGVRVTVEKNAGLAVGWNDDAYEHYGAEMTDDIDSIWNESDLVVKVKEPYAHELMYLDSHACVFSYQHLAAAPELFEQYLKTGAAALAFETLEDQNGGLPLLVPMSEIAGTLSVHIGTTLLHGNNFGKGLMLGGLAGTERGKVVILGCGSAGYAAAKAAQATGANVTVFDIKTEALNRARALGPNVTALYASEQQIDWEVCDADLLIGAVLIPGAKAPVLVSENTVKNMSEGSAVIDIAVDQGGCIETIKPTDHEAPFYTTHDVVHYGVTNMPGVVAATASTALSETIFPYVKLLAEHEVNARHMSRLPRDKMKNVVNVSNCRIEHEGLKP